MAIQRSGVPILQGLDPKTYKSTLTRLEDGRWNSRLEAHGKNSKDFKVVIFSGEHTKGSRYRHGKGYLSVDFTLLRSIDPSKVEEGKIDASYNTDTLPYMLDVKFINFIGQDGKGPVDSLYGYRKGKDGTGEFSYDALADMDSKGKEENLKLLSRWILDGSGRCDGRVMGGDIDDQGIKEIIVSECWDANYKRVYFESFINSSSYGKLGDSNLCFYKTIKLP
ncbi:MAG: hypothetical protein N2746_06550 [Deltaproteobacteria bacterium]|nr:hypothetical protein [Deltaproteobacteria bacterium]